MEKTKENDWHIKNPEFLEIVSQIRIAEELIDDAIAYNAVTFGDTMAATGERTVLQCLVDALAALNDAQGSAERFDDDAMAAASAPEEIDTTDNDLPYQGSAAVEMACKLRLERAAAKKRSGGNGEVAP